MLAFYDIHPQAKVHFLVIPKRHIASAAALTEGDAALLGHIFAVICSAGPADRAGKRLPGRLQCGAGCRTDCASPPLPCSGRRSSARLNRSEKEKFIMDKTYTLHVAGLTRELTICKVNDHLDIAAFIMLGDAELTVATAAELLKKCPEFQHPAHCRGQGHPPGTRDEPSERQALHLRTQGRQALHERPRRSWRTSPSRPPASRNWSLTARSWRR